MLSRRSQTFLWITALVATLVIGIVQVATGHSFRIGYFAATACVAAILAERALRSYFKGRNKGPEESTRLRGN